MNKSEVCVRLTRKNCKKVLEILEMLREPIHRSTFDRISRSDLDGFYIEFWEKKWIDSGNYENKTLIKPRGLRNILAKKHLKAGDICIFGHTGSTYIAEIESIKETAFNSSKYIYVFKDNSYSEIVNTGGYFPDFIRFATDEEKALLGPKKKPVTVTKEVWVNHYSNGKFDVYENKDIASFTSGITGQTVKATLTYDIPMTKV